MNQPDAPNTGLRHRKMTVDAPRPARSGSPVGLHTVRCCVAVVAAAVFATVLVPVAVSAHDGEDVTTTEEVDVYNYQTRRVQVAPFSETTTVDVYNYEDQQVRVAPFSETKTIDVFNYQTRRVRVAPFTKTVTSQVYFYEARRVRVAPFSGPGRVAVFNYENQRVRVAPFSEARAIPVYNYRTVKSGCRPPRGCVYTRVRVAPFTSTVQVDVYNYQTRKVRVAPFTKTGQVPLFNYQTRQVRVAPTHKTETVDVFNYENRRVRVAPFTSTVRMDLFNYETRRVRVAPFTKTVTVDVENYENKKVRVAPFTKTVTKTVTRHDPTQHTCPNGQHMKPLPPLRVARHGHYYTPEQLYDYRISGEYTFTERIQVYVLGSDRLSTAIKTVPVEWEETNAHTGCHQPKYPTPPETKKGPSVLKTFWDVVTGPVKDKLESATISATKPLQKAQPAVYAIVYHGVCTIGAALELLWEWAEASPVIAKYRDQIVGLAKRIAEASKKAKFAAGVAGVVAVAIELLLCNFGVKPGDNDLPDLTETTPTTTTTTVPPTTTTTTTTTTTQPPTPKVDPPKPTVNPLGLPVVSHLPSYDHTKYWLKFSESRDPAAEGCTPWVFWARLSRSLWKCPR